MEILLANSVDPNQMPHHVASDLGLYCLPMTLLQFSWVSPSAFSRRAVVSYWRKYVLEVLVNRLGGLSLPRKSVVRLTDRPDMTLNVYRGPNTTTTVFLVRMG